MLNLGREGNTRIFGLLGIKLTSFIGNLPFDHLFSFIDPYGRKNSFYTLFYFLILGSHLSSILLFSMSISLMSARGRGTSSPYPVRLRQPLFPITVHRLKHDLLKQPSVVGSASPANKILERYQKRTVLTNIKG